MVADGAIDEMTRAAGEAELRRWASAATAHAMYLLTVEGIRPEL